MTQDKRNKIVFVHEQVKMNFLDRKVYEKKIKKIGQWQYEWDYILISLDIGNCRDSIKK